MPNATSHAGPLRAGDVASLQIVIAGIGVQSLAYGCFMVLAAMAWYQLTRKNNPSTSTPTVRKFMLTAVALLCISSTIGWATSLTFQIQDMTVIGPNPLPISYLNRVEGTYVVSFRVNYIISDAIVVWRAWILSDRLFLRIGLATCLIVTISCAIIELIFTLQSMVIDDTKTKNPLQNLILILPVLITNLFTTAIIGYKTLLYQREIKANLNTPGDKKTRVERVLILLVESGFLYATYWAINIFVPLIKGFPRSVNAIVAVLLPMFSAIYPVAIILLVAHGKASDFSTINHSSIVQTLHFASRHSTLPAASLSIVRSIVSAGRGEQSRTDQFHHDEFEFERHGTERFGRFLIEGGKSKKAECMKDYELSEGSGYPDPTDIV